MQQTTILLAFVSNDQVLCLAQPVHAFQSASYSTFTTLSALICHSFPNLSPPNFQIKFQHENPIEFPSKNLCFSKYFQPWSKFLSLIFKDHQSGWCSKVNDQFCVIRNVSKSFFQVLQKQNHREQIFKKLTVGQISTYQLYSKHWNKNKMKKRIAILVLFERAHNDEIRPTNYELSTFSGIWFEPGDSWTQYQVIKGEIPSAKQLSQYQALFLSGSELCINDYNQNVNKIQKNILEALQLNKKLKIVGICFGHQLIAKMFGGKIQRRESRCRIQKIKFERQKIQKIDSLEEIYPIHECTVTKIHSDYITEAPPMFQILASSQGCPNQCMISEDRRILSFQNHPECTYQNISALCVRQKKYYEKDSTFISYFEEFRDDSLSVQTLQQHHQSLFAIRRAIRSFIDSQ